MYLKLIYKLKLLYINSSIIISKLTNECTHFTADYLLCIFFIRKQNDNINNELQR